MKSKERADWVDAARGFVIILMLVGHADPPELIGKYIFGFHMPFFFILSGYLFNYEKWNRLGFKTLIRNRFKAYVVPYFILSFINLLINLPIEMQNAAANEGGLLRSTLKHIFWIFYNYRNSKTSPNCTPLWFLIGLFVATIYLYGLLQIKNVNIRFLLCVLGSILCAALKHFDAPVLPWHIESALIAMVFMYMGYILRTKNVFEDMKDSGVGLVSVISLVLLGSYAIFMNDKLDINGGVVNNIILMYAGAFALSVSVLWMFRYYVKQNRFLEYLGKNTIVIMAFNYAINSYSRILFRRLPVINGINYTWWMISLVDVIVSMILIYAWRCIKKKFPAAAIF